MSPDHRAIARKIYEATETGNVALLDDAVTDDVIEHPLNPGQVRGRAALKQVFGGLSALVADLRLTNDQVVLAGDRVAVRSTVTGTAIGPYMGVPPAGRSMTFGAIDIWRFDGDRIAEGWHVEDFARILVDWGMLNLPRRQGAPETPPGLATAASTGAGATSVVRRWYEAVQRHDLDAVRTLLHPDYANGDPHGPSLTVTPGVEGAVQDVRALHEAFPDLDVTVADVFAEDDIVAARVVVRGTHMGPLAGFDPTGRRTAVMGNELWRVDSGRILQHWGRFEDLDLLQQLGVLAAG